MKPIQTLDEFAKHADFSLLETLTCDPKANTNGVDHNPREVFSGHYVHVNPTPIENPTYIAHSHTFFAELGLDDALATSQDFMRMFSGDTSNLPEPLKKQGWATGYALSIYGSEYYQQCPFGTGNGYGDGRAVSIFEGLFGTKRYEMQLKGGGRTPYCRGADGKAVLRSSIREFLAQEHMHALGVPTSRSLALYTSTTETVKRPWFNQGSYSRDPEVMIEEAVAITTRVAPSFLRVGQLELFGRRARKNEHPQALQELEQLFLHLIEREYKEEIDPSQPLAHKVLTVATAFRTRLTHLVAHWIRVGYCQGNFNSDNTALGGFTLDFGPFGFMDVFDPKYQPWTGGGVHFSFLNQPQAAGRNFHMFILSLKPLLAGDTNALTQLEAIDAGFSSVMKAALETMLASKLGLERFDEPLFNELYMLMIETQVDYTIFFRELSHLPHDVGALAKSFYHDAVFDTPLMQRWQIWLESWRTHLPTQKVALEALSTKMKATNPKYTLREWHLVSAYKQAQEGDFTRMLELQELMTHPYDEQSQEIQALYYKEKPSEFFDIAGISHISCSS